MKVTKLCLIAAGVAGLSICASQAFAAHSGGDVTMRGYDGAALTDGTTTTYSPKQTCSNTAQNSLTGCHNYESDVATATKSFVNRAGDTVTEVVPYPQHGVTAGYHFQQGRSIDWDAEKRSFYGLPSFTSSPGMVGKY